MPIPRTGVLILDAHSPFAHSVALCLADDPAVAVHGLANTGRSPLRWSRVCASFRVHSAHDDAALLRVLEETIRRTRSGVVLPTDLDAVRFASTHRERISVWAALPPLPDVDAFDMVADKWRFAGFLADHGLPHPCTSLGAAPDGRPAVPESVTYPVLLKPRDGAGGSGIRRFDDPAALISHLRALRADAGRYIVQEAIAGHDFDCAVLCDEGRILAHAVHWTLLPDRRAYRPSAAIEYGDHAGVLAVVARLMAALNWSGMANIDLRMDSAGRVFIIEVNPRHGGSLRGSHAAGVNFAALSCCAARNVSFARPSPNPTRYVIKHYLWTPLPGTRGRAADPRLSDLSLRESIWKDTLRDPLPDLYRLLKHRQ